MFSISTAIIPAGGLGTRLAPLSRVVPKELFPLGGRPVLQHCVEEAVEAGLSRIILVIRPGKEALVEYWQPSQGPPRGTFPEWEAWEALRSQVTIETVYQPEPRGLGDALACCKEALNGQPAAVLLPDNIFEPGAGVTRSLVLTAHQIQGSVIAVTERHPPETSLPPNEAPISGTWIPNFPGVFQTVTIGEKGQYPLEWTQNGEALYTGIGRWVAFPEVFKAAREVRELVEPPRELEDIRVFQEVLKTFPVYAQVVRSRRFDTGTWEGYRQAVAAWLP